MFKLSHPSGFTALELWIIKDAASLEPWTWQKEAAASAMRLCVNGRSPGQGSELSSLSWTVLYLPVSSISCL